MSNEVIELFDHKSKDWDQKYQNGMLDDRLAAFSKSVLSYAQPGASLLDSGCGSGVFCQHFNAQGFDVTGVDISPMMIESSKRKQFKHKDKIQFFCGDLVQIQKRLQTYDNIISASVLEYVPNDKVFLETLFQLLNKGGFLYITIPNSASKNRKNEKLIKSVSWLLFPMMIFGKVRRYLKYLKVSKNRYTLQEFSNLVRSIGFSIKEASCFNPTDAQNEIKTSTMLFFILTK